MNHPIPQSAMPLPIMGNIPFSQNWNNKLLGHFFTTIRLQNEAFYVVGAGYGIILQKEFFFNAKLHQVRHCKLHELPEITCFLDTGYSKQASIAMFQKMYAGKDWNKQMLSILLLESLAFKRMEKAAL